MKTMPTDIVVAMRQLVACRGKMVSEYPEWFQAMFKEDNNCYNDIVAKAADELEELQQNYGRLFKMIYGD